MPNKSKAGRDELTSRVQLLLNLKFKKEAEKIINTVFSSVEQILIENLDNEGFILKLNKFGKFSIRHRKGIERVIPFTGETKMTNGKRKVRFNTLGTLRKEESNNIKSTEDKTQY